MNIPKSKLDIIIEVLCIVSLIGVLIYILISWVNIPDEIPGHYNAAGQIDRVTNKISLLAIYATNLIMYIGISVIEKFPRVWNTGVRVTAENWYRVYRTMKSMVKITKLLLVLIFSYLIINSALALPLPIWFTPITLILIFGSLAYYILKLYRVK